MGSPTGWYDSLMCQLERLLLAGALASFRERPRAKLASFKMGAENFASIEKRCYASGAQKGVLYFALKDQGVALRNFEIDVTRT